MADALVKKKQKRAGHKGSATKTIHKIDEAFRKDPIDRAALSALKLALSEKLETIKVFDTEVLDLIDNREIKLHVL